MPRTRLLSMLATFAALAVPAAGCGSESGSGPAAPPTTMRSGNTDTSTYELACPSPIGTLTTNLTFTVTDSLEQVRTGEQVTYEITAPIAQVKAPVTPTFESSTTVFAIPEGFDATEARTEPETNADFTASSATIADGSVSYTLTGDFPIDGTPRPTPTVLVTGTITAPSGSTIRWMTPTQVEGKAKAGIFGTQTSTCNFPTAGVIGTTQVSG